MSVQQFCLRWNNHQPNFISVCSSLLHNGTLVDVTLAAEGRQLQAHKIVLSACSSYFQTLFTTNPCQHPIVILKDVQYDDLKTMVDFMYYGEVNVSQEQLPHILKTAEMLKIKGLAEMPTDPANLTKTDSKSVNEPSELAANASSAQGGGSGSSGGLSSSTGGSASDSLWGSTESQFQQQQQQQPHHHNQQLTQQQQQQHHHHQQQQQQHHQQQQQPQSNQIQNAQQHHQLRRTPSPLGANASPATRRKRLRKSSNNGSGDRNNSEDQHNTSLETSNATGGGASGGISLSQINQMPFGASTSASALSGLSGHTLHAAKLLKESNSADVEPHPQDSDSLEDAVHMQIKPEVDISGVQQSMPLDISGATTPSEHDAPNSQSSHSDAAVVTSECNEREEEDSAMANAVQQQPQPQPQLQPLQMGTKRNRVLTRQPRIKRDSDSLSNNQASPEPPPITSSVSLDFEPFSGDEPHQSHILHAHQQQPQHPHHHQQHQHHVHHLLTVPPRIERHASEPAPSMAPSSPQLLTVPTTATLIKQHSDPLLPSHMASSSAGGGIMGATNQFAPLHRQYSHPLPSSSGGGSGHHHSQHHNSGGGSHLSGVAPPLLHPHHISLPEAIYASGSPPPVGSSQYLVPQTLLVQSPPPALLVGSTNALVTTITTTTSSNKSSSTSIRSTSIRSGDNKMLLPLPQLTTTDSSGGGTNTLTVADATAAPAQHQHAGKLRSSKSASGALLMDRNSLWAGPLATGGSFEHLPTIRVKNEELQRSVSSPQTSREIITLENPRSSHCPVIRPGPALGCNFCWNTIDGHGRILRRKTKYHCPECQTNLCIVPCFQEYHERLNNEAATSGAAGATAASAAANSNNNNNNNNAKNCSNTSSGGGGGGVGGGGYGNKTESI